jgi:hypothetical protein
MTATPRRVNQENELKHPTKNTRRASDSAAASELKRATHEEKLAEPDTNPNILTEAEHWKWRFLQPTRTSLNQRRKKNETRAEKLGFKIRQRRPDSSNETQT